MSYEVLYNACYGGFFFPQSFLDAVFEAFPPESPLGAKLWQVGNTNILSEDETPDPTWIYYNKIVGTVPFAHGYERLMLRMFTRESDGTFTPGDIQTKPSQYVRKSVTGVIYFMATYYYDRTWRTSPEIIAMAREHDLISANHDDSLFHGGTELQVATIPVGYDYEIRDYNGKENIRKKVPYRQIICELIELYKTRDESALSPLTRALLDGSLSAKSI